MNNFEIYPISVYENWHPKWFVPGARCKSNACQWVGTILGFTLGTYEELGVIRTDAGVIIRTDMTADLSPI